MVRDELSVLSAFQVVVEERSFTRAAKQRGVSSSAVSHAIRGLEERLGVRLLARTTRSVASIGAGEQFLARLGPALADVRGALDQVTGLRYQPAGRVRLVASRLAARMLLAPRLAQFARDYRTCRWSSPRPRRVGWTSWVRDSTPGSISASLSNATWSQSACRRNSGRRSSARRAILHHIRSRSRHEICRRTTASTFDTDPQAFITGSSTRVGSRSQSPSTDSSPWTTWTF